MEALQRQALRLAPPFLASAIDEIQGEFSSTTDIDIDKSTGEMATPTPFCPPSCASAEKPLPTHSSILADLPPPTPKPAAPTHRAGGGNVETAGLGSGALQIRTWAVRQLACNRAARNSAREIEPPAPQHGVLRKSSGLGPDCFFLAGCLAAPASVQTAPERQRRRKRLGIRFVRVVAAARIDVPVSGRHATWACSCCAVEASGKASAFCGRG